MPDIERQLDALDVGVFAKIHSQTTDEEKRSLLALQRGVRGALGRYVYLEIGSHLGGSIQPHLLDPRCELIYSIDKRPRTQPDERGETFTYDGNSTERMLDELGRVAPGGLGKVICFEDSAENIEPSRVERPPDLCFIDGEHTNRAVVSDFDFCLSVCAPNAVIAMHDSNLVFAGIARIRDRLRERAIEFRELKLGGSVYALALRDSAVPEDAAIRGLATSATLYFLRARVWLAYKRFKNRSKRA
jgi:hypothetical protein